MVAGALHGLGISMGDNLPENIEDPDFNADQKESLSDFIEHMKATINLRNRKSPVWGWKFPRAAIYLKKLHPFIRNPHYVVIHRDPVPGAIRQARSGVDEIQAIEARLRASLANTQLVRSLCAPTIFVSYEKASAHPEIFLAELSKFTDTPLPSDLFPLLDFMKPGSYKNPLTLR